MSYAITVELEIDPAKFETFLGLIKTAAKAAKENEPGCLQFTVAVPREGANKIMLFEEYKSEADLGVHREQAHFAAFQKASAGMVIGRKLTAYEVVG